MTYHHVVQVAKANQQIRHYREIEQRWASELYELDEHATYRLLAAGEMAGRTGSKTNIVLSHAPFLWGWLRELGSLLDEAERLTKDRGIFGKSKGDRLTTIFEGPVLELRRSEIPQDLPDFVSARLVDVDYDSQVVLVTLETLTHIFRVVSTPVRDVVAEVDAVWRDLMPRISAGGVTMARAEGIAQRLKMTVPEVRRARQRLDAVKSSVSDDPLGLAANVGETLDELIEDAARAAGNLERAHGNIDEDIDAMTSILAGLRVLRARAAAAFSESEAKIAPTTTLRRVPSTAVIDGPNGLAHRAAQLADVDGPWQDRRREIDRWHDMAKRLEVQLQNAYDTNSTAIEDRNELRGLLRAYRSKAVMMPDLDESVQELGDAAHEELFTSPTDLEKARDLIAKFSARLSGVS